METNESTIDESMYTNLPYNGLATSSEIILNQMKELGVELDETEPSGGDSTLTQNIATLTPDESRELDLRQYDERDEAIRVLASKQSVPIDRSKGDDRGVDLAGPTVTNITTSAPAARTSFYDGPPETKRTLGTVLTSYGLPKTFGELLSDAEEAFTGIVYDLNHIHENRLSIYDILVKNNRLRGLGAIFVVTAIIGILLNIIITRR